MFQFQFNVIHSSAYITPCQDLRPQQILFPHLADVGLISVTNVWITAVITALDSFIKMNYIFGFNGGGLLRELHQEFAAPPQGKKTLRKQQHGSVKDGLIYPTNVEHWSSVHCKNSCRDYDVISKNVLSLNDVNGYIC